MAIDFLQMIEGKMPYPYKPIGQPQLVFPDASGTLVQWPKSDFWTTDLNGTPDTINIEAAGTSGDHPHRIKLNSGGNTNDIRDTHGQRTYCKNVVYETRLTVEDANFSAVSATNLFAFDNENMGSLGDAQRGVRFTNSDTSTYIRWEGSGTDSLRQTNFTYDAEHTWITDRTTGAMLYFRVFPTEGVAAFALNHPDNITCISDVSDYASAPNASYPTTDWTDCAWRIRVKQTSSTEKNLKTTRMVVENFG